jgi:hypothetical protein
MLTVIIINYSIAIIHQLLKTEHSQLQLFIRTSTMFLYVQNHYENTEYFVWNISLTLISLIYTATTL